MKTKRIATLILSFVMVLFAAFAIGCKKNNGTNTSDAVKEITLENATASIKAGGSLTYADYKVVATYTSGKKKTVPLTEAMLKAEDLAKFENAGTYDLEVTAFGKTTVLTVTVTNYTFENLTAADLDTVYDGTAKTPVVTGAPQGYTVVWSYYLGTDKTGDKVNEAVNAGTYFAEGVVSCKYYDDATVTANVVIAKKTVNPAELNWINTKRVSTGSAITANVTATDLPDGVTLTYDGAGKTGTAAGKYTVTVKFTNTNPNYVFPESYDVEWEIIAPLNATWYGADNGTLYVAGFKSATETTGTLTFDGKTTTYTVAYDTNGNATFTNLNGNVSAISLKGGILRVTAGDTTYALISGGDMTTYFTGSAYDMLLARFELALNESARTFDLVITTEDGEQTYPLTLTAGESETLARNVTLSATETMYVTYYNSYGNVRIYGFVNPDGYKSNEYYDLAKANDVATEIAKLFNGEFKDVDGNTLVVNGKDDIKYNGRTIKIYATLSYGKMKLAAAVDTDKRDAEFVINNGYYGFAASSYSKVVFADAKTVAKAGTYYIVNGNAVANTQTVEFMTYAGYGNYDVRTKLVKGEATESNTFTVNGAETANRAVLTVAQDGTLTATLYLKNSTDVYATLVFNKNGMAVTYGEVNFKKVDKLLLTGSSYSPKTYYAADGTTLKYDGKGTFTFTDANGNKVYTEYALAHDGDEMTITLGSGEDVRTVVVGEDSRYITVDGDVYINDDSSAKQNGYNLSATFVAGDEEVVINKNVVTVNNAALTDLEYSFVDDGNNNGRTVLQIKGKNGNADVTVLFYSLMAIKIGDKGYAIEKFSTFYGATYKPVEDENKSFTITTAGKLMINGGEVFPTNVGSSNITYYLEKNGQYIKCTAYDNSSSGYITVNEDVQLDYTSEFFREYRGLYVSEDNKSVFAYLKSDTIYASETSYSSVKVKSATDEGTVLTVGSKEATLKTVDGLREILYDGKTYKQVKGFEISDYYGTYSVLNGNNYDTLTVASNLFSSNSSAQLKKFVMLNGECVPVINYNSYNSAYLFKNNDSATKADLPYYAVNEYYIKFVGEGKLDGKVLDIRFEIATKNNKKVPVMTVTYDGAPVTLTDIRTFALTAQLDGKKYTIEAASGDDKQYADLKIYESVYSDFTNGSYLFNGDKAEVTVEINEDGESVVVFKFNDNEVTATFTDAAFGKLVTFTDNGANYKGQLASNATPRVRVASADEYAFFFESDYNDTDEVYTLTIADKAFKFAYETKAISRNYSAYEFAFTAAKTSYDGKVASAVTYASAIETVVFTTADGTYAYNLKTKALTANVSLGNFASLIDTKEAVSNGDVYVTARVTAINGTDATVTLYYDLGNDGLKAVTATAVEGGYKLSGEGVATTYMLEEDGKYALYTEDQYTLAGTYTVGGKQLVIAGDHAKGKFTYTAAYDGAAAVAITPDFTAKSFMIKGETAATIFNWTVEGTTLNFTATEVPAAAMDFVLGETFMSNLNETYTKLFMNIEFKGIVDGKVKYNVGWKTYSSGSYKIAEGTLSDDGKYIMANVYYDDLYIYLNAESDEYYDYVAIKKASNPVMKDYIGTFLNGDLKIELAAKSTDDDGEPKFSESSLKITYNGKTAKTAYSATVTDGIEFTIDGKTYVAKLANGAMTVTEKAAA